MNKERETLQIVSLGTIPLYDKHYIGVKETQVIQDPFISGIIHPVVKRLGIHRSEDHLDYFQELVSYSEEFGKEQGYITQLAIKRINLITKQEYERQQTIYKEQEARKELTIETVESISTYSKILENTVRNARDEYVSYLSDLGYIEEETGDYDEDTRYFMIHPLFINEWRQHPYKDYPDWAVKEIGYFPEN